MMTKDQTASLEQRAAELRAIVARPSPQQEAEAELQRIEAQMAEQRDAAGKHAATERMVGIARAYGSLADQVNQDEKRLVEKVAAARAAMDTLNERFGKLEHLRAEAAALADRFGVAPPSLPRVVAPAHRQIDAMLPVPVDHQFIRPRIEKDETRLRERRSYEEVSDTPGFNVIMQAGLRPWPPLTPHQQAVVAAREAERAALRRQLASLPAVPAYLPNASVKGL